jgi:glycosyltransferase involved in cell wall biosynthesis
MCRASVIIPTYNRAVMVCEAIDSVLAQSLPDVEAIVVDDGSTDVTARLLSLRYGDRIRYFHQENRGRSTARNRGIRVARGEYLVFLDSDDRLLPQGLEVQVEVMERFPDADVVYGDGYYCDRGWNTVQRISEERPALPEEGLLAIMVLHNIVIAPPSAMVRRRALDCLGEPWFDELLRGMEDADFWLRLAAAGAHFVNHPEPVCQYRLHDENASSHSHPRWGRRWKSVQRFKHKVLYAPFFPDLPLWVRLEFIRQLLLIFLEGEPEAQSEVLGSNHFQSLPVGDRAHLFYLLGKSTIVQRYDGIRGREWLAEAVRLVPRRRYRLALGLAHAQGIPLQVVTGLRSRLVPRRLDKSLAPHWRKEGGKG